MSGSGERGIALAVVLIVLASMAVLMSGVYYLISGSTRSANTHVSFQATRSTGESGLGQAASLIDRVAVTGFDPPAPSGYGVNLNVWGNLQTFGDFIRGEANRPGPCSQANPDISYAVTGQRGDMQVAACVTRVSAGSIAGSGGGMEFLRTSQGTADQESLFEVTVWVTGPDGETQAQRQASIRAFH